jgi:hypothetical protein
VHFGCGGEHLSLRSGEAATAGAGFKARGRRDRQPAKDRTSAVAGGPGVIVGACLHAGTQGIAALGDGIGCHLQHLLCQAINDLFEKNGQARIADEDMLPRGGAAYKSRTSRDGAFSSAEIPRLELQCIDMQVGHRYCAPSVLAVDAMDSHVIQ